VLYVQFIVDETLKIGELERELLVTYDPAAVKELVPKLASKVGNNQAVYLTDKVRSSCIFCCFILIWQKDILVLCSGFR